MVDFTDQEENLRSLVDLAKLGDISISAGWPTINCWTRGTNVGPEVPFGTYGTSVCLGRRDQKVVRYKSLPWGFFLDCYLFIIYFFEEKKKQKRVRERRLPYSIACCIKAAIKLRKGNSDRHNFFNFIKIFSSCFISICNPVGNDRHGSLYIKNPARLNAPYWFISALSRHIRSMTFRDFPLLNLTDPELIP